MDAAKPPSGTAPPGLGRGEVIGRYIVLGFVGQGSMGEVYAAYDPELDRKVAVKLLRKQAGTDGVTAAELKSRLLREAQAIARLSHPNVIVVHDVGSFADRVFVAMEFVDGNTLGYWLLAAKRSWKDVLRVFMAAGRGLAAAHASQLVHRDFKVENVMVGRDGQVRVMDFGLARRVTGAFPLGQPLDVTPARTREARDVTAAFGEDDDKIEATRIIMPSDASSRRADRPSAAVGPRPGDGDSRPRSGATDPRRPTNADRTERLPPNLAADLTQTGAIVGTPAYMAPEQFDGQSADERSDQFSFCVALHEGLFGERPFAGTTIGELSDNVRKGQLLTPADSTGVPGWLRRVVLRGLRTDPSERWPSMEALLTALQADPSSRWRRGAIVATAVMGIAIVGILARRQGALQNRPSCQVTPDRFSRVWEPVPSPGSRRAAIVAAFRASGQPYAADALASATRLLDGYVAVWSSMYTDSCAATNLRGEQSAEVLDLRMSCLRERWYELRALSDVLAEPDGEVVANAVKAAAALTPLDECADLRTLRQAVPPPRDPETRRKVDELRGKLATAKALHDAGRFAKALGASAELVVTAQAIGYPPLLAEALARLGFIQAGLGNATEAEANLDEAIWIAEGARSDEVVATASVEQIYITGSLERDMPRATRWMRQAEASLTRLGGHELLRAWMLNNYGTALDSHGYLQEAATRYRSALEIKERVLGPSHPDVGTSLTNLAITLTALGKPEEALEYSNRGVAIVGQALGWEHPDTAHQMTNRADVLNQVGRYSDAKQDAERGLAIWEKETGLENAELPLFLEPLGEAYLGLDQPAAAVPHLRRALAIAERQGDPASPSPTLRFALARALWDSAEDRVGALHLASELLSSLEAQTAPEGSDVQSQDGQLRDRVNDWVKQKRSVKAAMPSAARRLTERLGQQ